MEKGRRGKRRGDKRRRAEKINRREKRDEEE